MNILKGLHRYFTEPHAYICKPLWRDHEWRAPEGREKYPVCIHCGKECWWAYGYTLTLSGTRLGPDFEAQKLLDFKVPDGCVPDS